jgi:WD40 repeat protein
MTIATLTERLTKDLHTFSREIDRERAEFQLDKSELEQKVTLLETQTELKDRTIRDLTRRVALLEFALRRDHGRYSNAALPAELDEPKISEISGFLLDTLRRPRVKNLQSQISQFLADLEISDTTAQAPRLRLLRSLPVALEAPAFFAVSAPPKFPLITGGADGAILIWSHTAAAPAGEAPSGPRGLRGHEGAVLCCAIDTRGNVFSGGLDGTVRKFSDENSDCIVGATHTDAVWCIAVDEVTGALISGGTDCRLVFSSLDTLTTTSEVKLPAVPVALHLLGERVVVVTNAGDISVFDRKSLNVVEVFALGTPATGSTILGELVCVVDKSGTLTIVNLGSSDPTIKNIRVSDFQLTAVASLPGDFVAVGDAQGVVRLIDLKTEVSINEVELGAKIQSLSSRGRELFASLADGKCAELVLQ